MRILADAIQLVPVSQLTEHPDNPRRGDVEAIVSSVEAHGFYQPVVVQRSTGHVLAGNHRLKAARKLAVESIPVVYLDVGDDEARRILLVDNRTSDLGSYDEETLANLLAELGQTDEGLAGTGYTDEDLERLIKSSEPTDEVDLSDEYSDMRLVYLVCIRCDGEEEQIEVMSKLNEIGLEYEVKIQ